MDIKQIKELVASNRINQAFEDVKKLNFSEDLKLTFSLIVMNYKKLKDDLMLGIVSRTDENREIAIINHRFLGFLDSLESELKVQNEISNSNNTNPNRNRNIVIHGTSESNINIGTKVENTKPEDIKKQRILFIYSCPKEKMQLDFGQEIKKIKKSLIESNLKQRDKFEIEVEEAVAADDLFRLIKNHNPNYIHIALHGSKSKGLLFQGSNGDEHPITTEELSDSFELITMKNPDIQCVVLSACHSSEPAKALTTYVKYAIGSQAAIPDEAAIAFTRGFYEMIFDGEEVAYAFKAAKLAVKIAKIDSGIDDLPSHEIPVLYQQS